MAFLLAFLARTQASRPFASRAGSLAFQTTPALHIPARTPPVWSRIRGGDDSTGVMEQDEEEDESEDESEEEEDSSSATSSSSTSKPPISAKPLPVTVKTALGPKVLDQSIELTVNRSRDIASLKEALRRQLPGRPPVGTMELVLHGRRLPDDMLMDELIDEDDQDDDEEEDDEDSAASSALVLQLDMVPPVDPKFVQQLERDMTELTTAELLEAYTANEAAMYQNAALLQQQPSLSASDHVEGDDEPELAKEDGPLLTTQMRDRAAQIRQNLQESILNTPNAQKLLSSTLAPAAIQQSELLQAKQIRGQRVRHTAVSSVKTSLKRKIQHIWNINWATSVRYFCLFLFFGYFGGRTATSRAILLLGAPSVFVLQARPVQLFVKQLLYTLLDQPPGILLSLMPAPQQAILSLNMGQAMSTIYGGYVEGSSVNENSLASALDSDYDEDSIHEEEFFSAEEDLSGDEQDEDLDESDEDDE